MTESTATTETPDVSAEAVLMRLWEQHSMVRCVSGPGQGLAFQSFVCDTCRTPYPCATAREIATFGSIHPEYQYLALRCPIEGETIDESGRRASIGGHSWAVSGGAVPTTGPARGDDRG